MALCMVLSACLGRVPDSLVRSKFVSCATIVSQVIDQQRDQVHTPSKADPPKRMTG